jgi:hypothetical protein
MIDMKVSAPPSGSMLCGDEEKHAYPEGLKLKLEGDVLAKLGLSPDALPDLGTKMPIRAVVSVQELSKEEMADGTFEVCLELQIEQMELGDQSEPSIAERMYGGKNGSR